MAAILNFYIFKMHAKTPFELCITCTYLSNGSNQKCQFIIFDIVGRAFCSMFFVTRLIRPNYFKLDNKYHIYREQAFQGLQDGDQAKRLEFC